MRYSCRCGAMIVLCLQRPAATPSHSSAGHYAHLLMDSSSEWIGCFNDADQSFFTMFCCSQNLSQFNGKNAQIHCLEANHNITPQALCNNCPFFLVTNLLLNSDLQCIAFYTLIITWTGGHMTCNEVFVNWLIPILLSTSFLKPGW